MIKKTFVDLISILKTYSFWGIIFLLILVCGFKVNISDVLYEAKNGPEFLNYFCYYFLFSGIVFLISLIILMLCGFASLLSIFTVHLPVDMTIMFRGFTIIPYLISLKLGSSVQEIIQNILSYIIDIGKMVLWWAITYFGIYFITSVKGNRIITTINLLEKRDIYIRLGIILVIYIVVLIILKIVNVLIRKGTEESNIEPQEVTIYVTQGVKPTKFQRYWNVYTLKGDTVIKYKCSRSKFFNGRENEVDEDRYEDASWNISDPEMPKWLNRYIPMMHHSGHDR